MDPPVENSVDAIANELLKDDLRTFVESIYTGMNLKGGDQAFDFFFEEIAQFVDHTTCPTEIDIEKVSGDIPFEYTLSTSNEVFDYCDNFNFDNFNNCDNCNNILSAEDQQDQQQEEGQEISWGLLLDELFNESGTDLQQRGADLISSTKNLAGGNGGGNKVKKKKKRLDGKMLDALAKMMEEVPDTTSRERATSPPRHSKQDQDTAIQVARSSSGDPTVEEMSTMAFPGDHHHHADDGAPLTTQEKSHKPTPVFGFNRLAKEMEKVNFVKSMSIRARGQSPDHQPPPASGSPFRSLSSRRRNGCLKEESNEFAKIRGFSSRKPPMIAEDDWEYLEEETLSSNALDPVIESRRTLGDKDKKSPSKIWRKISTLGKSKKQLGRYRSVLKREDKISFDDDGSVQVHYHGKLVDPAKESMVVKRCNRRPVEVREADSLEGGRMPRIQLRLRTTVG